MKKSIRIVNVLLPLLVLAALIFSLIPISGVLAVVTPTASTQAASNIGGTTARISGNITDDGGASCEARFRYRDIKATLYENYNEGDVAGSCIHGTDWRGQTFTPATAHQITSVKLKLARVGLPGTLTVSIRATDGEGKPTGGDLCSGTIDGDTLTTDGAGEWREITFSPGYELTASTKYAIVSRTLTGDGSNYVSWRADSTSPTYTDGSNTASVNSGSTWILFTTTDMMFEEWGLGVTWTTTEWQNTLETDATYYEDLTGLEEETEYEFQTQAKNSAGEGVWSSSAYFETGITVPTVTTQAATNVEETTATGNGNIISVNDGSCDYRGVEWDTDSGAPYTYDATDAGSFGTGAFTKGMTGLNPGTLYYYRAKAHNSAGWGYGAEETFLTKPNNPTTFVATPGDTQVSLSWVKGTGAENTIIRGKIDSYPANYDTDTDVYSGTGTATTHTGLTNNDHWYYRAWSKTTEGALTQYSDSYAQDDATPVAGNPATTTNDATGVGQASATLNGILDSLGSYSPVYVFFQYGKTTSYGTNTAEQTRTSTGSFAQEIAGLDPNTTYYFRAVVKFDSSYVYGANKEFQTTGLGPPAVFTGTAASITISGATLQGTLTGLGDYSPVYVFFQYGLTTEYGTATPEQTKTATGGFNQAISSLAANTLYHFRSVARYGASSYVHGADNIFTTSTVGTSSVSTVSATSITQTGATLQGSVNSLGGYSTVNAFFQWGQTTSYGTTTTEQTKSTIDGFTQPISGLTAGATYHFRAALRYGTDQYVYGADKVFVAAAAGEPGIDPPDILRIDDVKVYLGYFEEGDQLYVINYRIIYTTGTPIMDVGDYFDFVLYDGVVVKAKIPVRSWGYRPGSLSLKADSALLWGGEYMLKIEGNPNKWETALSDEWALSNGDWQGDDLSQLDTWVIALANSMQSYYDVQMVDYAEGMPYLSDQGAVIFNMGIIGLCNVRPHLCSPYYIPGYPDTEDRDIPVIDTEERVGPQIYDASSDVATFFGLDDVNIPLALVFGSGFLAVAIILSLILGSRWGTGGGLAGIGIASPILIFGAWLGFVPFPLIIIVAAICVVYTVFTIWVKGV